MLWADTFNNHFLPDTAKAAVEVLEAAGSTSLFRTRISLRATATTLACSTRQKPAGRHHGRAAARNRSGILIVVLEPSCAAVFRDELTNLFPGRERAR
jgi:Fe-S oxidoreductase